MSEYQYYEFQAVDRPLTEHQMKELRRISTRARITSTSFTNNYSWGDFKGNPRALMEKYFDAFLYLANWGTHWLMLRLPRRLLDPEIAEQYCVGDYSSARATGEHVVLEFQSESEEGGWVEEEDGWLSSMIHLRAELAGGDLRCLYLAWLLSVQEGELEDDDLEPPVPPNLRDLSAAQQSFSEFLRIDDDLIAVAAEASADRAQASASGADLKAWLGKLPPAEKDECLLRMIEGNDPYLGVELRQRFERECRPAEAGDDVNRRTAGELFQAAEVYTEERRRRDAERKAREKAKRERTRAAARRKYLKSLRRKAPSLWSEVARLIATRQPKRYDEAVSLLEDLRDLAEMEKTNSDFSFKMNALAAEHARKPSLIKRFWDAELLI